MKKLILASAVVLVLVALTAIPAMAAPKTLTFETGLYCTAPGTVSGDIAGGFIVTTTGTDTLIAFAFYNPSVFSLKDGMYAFHLKAKGPQKAELKSYFAEKEWPFPEWYRQINAEIAGGLPFFYVKVSGGLPNLVDGFVYGLEGIGSNLRINDDYPVGTYVYKGHLKGSNGALLQVEVTLTVERAP